ncbi:MAG: GIY-YIG nuclease family protein [Gemmatimonadota bacterium]
MATVAELLSIEQALSLDVSTFGVFDTESPPFIHPGIYVLSDADGGVIYVGESGDVTRRLKQHARDKRWYKKVVTVRSIFCSDRDLRLTGETLLILRHRPRHNRAIMIGLDATAKVYPLQFVKTRHKW